MTDGLDIAFFGSSIVSAWWNGACTYYRGVVRGLHDLGHRVTFYEPDAFDRQAHRDIDDPDYADVHVYAADSEEHVRAVVASAGGSDVIVKASGVGVHDSLLEEAVASAGSASTLRVFWDVDAPATLANLEANPADPLRTSLPSYDLVLTYGGGAPVVERYRRLGARDCKVVYNALDPATHFRVPPDPRYAADCALLANRLPDREDRIDEFFFRAAALLPGRRFLLGGNGWDDKTMPGNVDYVGHVGTEQHNAFNSTPTTVLNVTRDSMVANGWSPATRVFEAAGSGACLITDAWDGIADFLAPDDEVLVAHDGREVAEWVESVTPAGARRIGERAAARVLRCHTYTDRAAQVDSLLRSMVGVSS